MWIAFTILAAGAIIALVLLQLYWVKQVQQITRKHEDQVFRLKGEQLELTERFRAHQNALLNSMTEGLLVLDANNRIQVTNRALQELFNLSSSVVGQTVLEALRLHTLDEITERLETERQILDLEIDVPGLQSRCLQVNAAAIVDDDNQRLGSVMVFHELTRLKQLENTRQEFVANVSHELRTPLSMIKGYAETLLNGAKDDPEVSTRFLQTIEKHADRLAMLIDDLLTISQMEGGRLQLNLQKVQVQEVVASVFDDLHSSPETRQVILENKVDSSLYVTADFQRLKQVVWNLVENAIKYGKPNGSVVVAAVPGKNGRMQISVRDNGPGIPEAALPRIFERFYRVDKARSREAGGTGLGLSIVKHIIQCHEGEVWAESKLGEGSTFYFTLGNQSS